MSRIVAKTRTGAGALGSQRQVGPTRTFSDLFLVSPSGCIANNIEHRSEPTLKRTQLFACSVPVGEMSGIAQASAFMLTIVSELENLPHVAVLNPPPLPVNRTVRLKRREGLFEASSTSLMLFIQPEPWGP